jgi:hypothetical protein
VLELELSGRGGFLDFTGAPDRDESATTRPSEEAFRDELVEDASAVLRLELPQPAGLQDRQVQHRPVAVLPAYSLQRPTAVTGSDHGASHGPSPSQSLDGYFFK